MKRAGIAALLVLGLAGAGCESSDGSGTYRDDGPWPDASNGDDVPYVKPNPEGKAHGEPCTSDDECWHRTCISAPSLTGGAFKVCTKDCSEGPSAPCVLDGTGFTCVRFSPGSGDDLVSFCMPTCSSAADCPAGYDDCRVVVGALKTCATKDR